jgi:3-phosphoglycerate kinase
VGDEANDDAYARELCHGAHAFVNDAFGVCHRKQASVSGVCKYIRRRYAGLLMRSELTFLLSKLEEPDRCSAFLLSKYTATDIDTMVLHINCVSPIMCICISST